MTETISEITIIRGTVFDGEVVQPKQVCTVTDGNRADAMFLISKGKALAGRSVKAVAKTSKAVDPKTVETRDQ